MLLKIAYFNVLGLPLIGVGGIFSLAILLLTAAAPKLAWKGRRLIPFKWHVRLAYVTVAFALAHGGLALAILL